MRSPRPSCLVLVALLLLPLGCDWVPGSSLSWSQTVRTWDDLTGGQCLTLGSYTFAVGGSYPPFDAKASLKMKADNQDDQEFLPQYLQLNYRLNGSLFYQQEFYLDKGKGSLKGYQPSTWTFDPGDEIGYEICVDEGYLPSFTEIRARFDYKFEKLDFK